MENPLISVVVPVYNSEKYLERCLCSIINQTYTNLEIILVDDGSTDTSGKICNEYAAKDDRIVVIHKENGGLSSARNAGLSVANGKYVGFVDSDDYIKETMYEDLYKVIKEFNSQVSITGRIDVTSNNNHSISFTSDKEEIYSSEEAIKEILLKRSIDVSVCDKLFLTSLFSKVKFPEGETNEDAAIIFEILSMCTVISKTDKAHYYYFHHSNTISTTLSKDNLICLYRNTCKIYDFINSKFPDLRQEALHYCLTLHIYVYNAFLTYKNDKDSLSILFEIKKWIKSNKAGIRRNQYIPERNKIKIFLIKLGIYNMVYNVLKRR